MSFKDTANQNQYGFDLDSADQNTLTSNTVKENAAEGFIIEASTHNTFNGNTVIESGIDVWVGSGSSANVLKGNRAARNAISGFAVEELAQQPAPRKRGNEQRLRRHPHRRV